MKQQLNEKTKMENQPTENNNNFQPVQGLTSQPNINPQPIFSSSDIPTPAPTPLPTSSPQKPKTNLVAIIILIILALGGVGLGVFALVQNSNQPGTSDTKPETPNTPTQPDKEKEEDTSSEDQPEDNKPAEDTPNVDENASTVLKNIESAAETHNQKYSSTYDLLKKYVTNYTLPYSGYFGTMNIFLEKDSTEFEKYKYMLTMESDWWTNKYIRGRKGGDGGWELISGTQYTYDDIYKGIAPYDLIEYDISYDGINNEYHKLFSAKSNVQVSNNHIFCGCPFYSEENQKYLLVTSCGGGVGYYDSSYYFITDSKEQNNQLTVQVAHAYFNVDADFDENNEIKATSLKLNLNNNQTIDISSSKDFYNTYSSQLPHYQFTFVKENNNYVLDDFSKIN